MACLSRRHPVRPAETAWYLVYAPAETALADQYEVRSWQGWHRHITLALLALAALATAAQKGEPTVPATSPSRSLNSGGSWSASSGAPCLLQTRSGPGPGGVGITSGLLRNPTTVAV